MLRMISYVKLVESIPVIFDCSDSLLMVFIKQRFELLFCCLANSLCPHDVAYQMKEIAQTKTIEFYIILRLDIRYILFIIYKIMNGMFSFSPSQEVSDFLRWVELGPIFVRDSRIGREIAKSKRHFI